MKYRQVRVGDLIRKELSEILERELEFPLGSLVTISSVEVDKKFERALVLVSVLPPALNDEVLAILQKARGYLFHMLFKRLNIKPMPDIMFRIDKGPENAASVERVFLSEESNKPSRRAKVEKRRSPRRIKK